jgi:excisionase family DNA binding protein
MAPACAVIRPHFESVRSVEKLLSKKDLATYLAVSCRTIDRMRSAGQIRAVRVRGQVRFRPTDVEHALKRR